jgi:Uma2 family endonuclease
MAVQTILHKAEDLEQMPQSDAHVELVKGEVLTMPPAGHEHGEIALNIGSLLREYLRKHKLGKAYGAETGFILFRNPDTVRAPDAAFVSTERAARQVRKEGFFDGPPDLAVEVISPTDTDEEVEAKVLDYLQSGTRLVWVIRPRTRTVTAYRSLSNIRLLTDRDTLEGGDILPGFVVKVKDIFES